MGTHLAKEMAPKAMVMAMYINIPTTTLVHMSLAASCKGTAEEAFSTELLLHWKKMRETAKEKDKVADMERALREMDKQELADVFMDRHQGQMELSADCFPAHNMLIISKTSNANACGDARYIKIVNTNHTL